MHSTFRSDVRREGRAAVIVVSGELDLASSPALEDVLADVQTTDVVLVILDLRKLEFMDSTGLSVVVKAHRRFRSTGRRLALVKGSQQIQRLLDLTGVAEKLMLADTPEELLSRAGLPTSTAPSGGRQGS